LDLKKAIDVSADGSVILGENQSGETVRWENSASTIIGPVRGASAISADGSTIVGYGTDKRAYIWDADNGVRNLRYVLTNDFGLDLTGWTLKSATGVSDDGTVIVGIGINPAGHEEGWRAAINIDPLQAGDANQDLDINFDDIFQVVARGKYETGQPATWGEGDWDGAPGGEPGIPPIGDGVFDFNDAFAALASGKYETGPYAASGGVTTSVPEPSTLVLAVLAMVGFGVLCRTRFTPLI
jgi:hypothetical protein